MAQIESVNHISFNVETMFVRNGRKISAPKIDSDGYYVDFPVAALGISTRNQTYYKVQDFVKCMTDPGSKFAETLRDGSLYGELGHPDLSGMSHQEMLNRMAHIDEKNASHHIRSVASGEKLEGGGCLIAAAIKPMGPQGHVVAESMKSRYANTAFSLRSITRDQMKQGLCFRTMLKLVTFDFVLAGGYAEASKRFIPGSRASSESLKVLSLPSNDDEEIILSRVAVENFSDTEIAEIFGTNEIYRITESVSSMETLGDRVTTEERARDIYYDIMQ